MFLEICQDFFEQMNPQIGYDENVELIYEEEKNPDCITLLWDSILDFFTYKLHCKDK
jgi:hypothetical protein